MIVLNKAYLTGNEIRYIEQALQKQTSGNGLFTKKCHQFFQDKYAFRKPLLTTSCTDALEMAALLLNIKPGDEVIVPSFTFVSTANAFALRGANVIFADSLPDHPNIDLNAAEQLITPRTKAIAVVHYAGVAADMDAANQLTKKYGLAIVEDAAQCIDAYYKGKPLGGIGSLGCFSFHDTKNIVCGEGGLLSVNSPELVPRAEILWEKGTNRSAFIRGEVDKYGWVDVGSSFLPSELNAAFLLAQLEEIEIIQKKRKQVWNYYMQTLPPLVSGYGASVPVVPEFANHNAHIFYLTCETSDQRNYLTASLKKAGIQAFFHYPPLHLSKFYLQNHKPASLPNASRFFEQLIRLPVYSELKRQEQDYVIENINKALASYRPPR